MEEDHLSGAGRHPQDLLEDLLEHPAGEALAERDHFDVQQGLRAVVGLEVREGFAGLVTVAHHTVHGLREETLLQVNLHVGSQRLGSHPKTRALA